jgi:lysophospholipase L1-like esterase
VSAAGEAPLALREILQMKIQLIALTTFTALSAAAVGSAALRFDFSGGKPAPGIMAVSPTNIYSDEIGFGFELVACVVAGGNCVTSEKPFLFSVKLPEGNYSVTVTFGDETAASDNTVKAEMRRLMLEQIKTAKGATVSRAFTVNVRTPKIPGGSEVRLKARERESEMVNWDGRLTLEFNGSRPALRSLVVEPVLAPTVFLVGDSTVCDQPREPWNSWGQMLPRFFGPGVAVANHAQSGESIKSSLSARRFEKVFSQMKSNDWLFVQFGHNDMKDKATNALVTYKANLKKIVAQMRERGATPVLVTSMERKGGVERDTLEGYPQTVRDVALEDRVALIDLHATSKVFYRALGPNLDKAFQDGTHHNNYGSYQLARCIVEGIRSNAPGLAEFLSGDARKFDPAQPDAPDQFKMTVSAAVDSKKPDGN